MNYLSYSKRIKYILELIEKGNLNSPIELAEKFDCSEKTIRNMINTLRESGKQISYCKLSKKYILKKGAQINEQSSKNKVTSYLLKNFSITLNEITDNELLIKNAGLNSLELIELIIWIEKETNCPVEMDELLFNNDITINGIINYIDKYSEVTERK